MEWADRVLLPELAKLDVRNAIQGTGISIDATPDRVATISASEDLGELFDADFVMAEASPLLPNARLLRGEGNVIDITDAGPGAGVTVGIAQHSLHGNKLRLSDGLSVVGNPASGEAEIVDIPATADDTALVRVGGVLGFGKVTPAMIDPAITTRYLVPVANGDAASPEAVFDDTGDFVFADAVTF